MGLFTFKRKEKKQKQRLFGNGIVPDCAYCLHNSGTAQNSLCPFAGKAAAECSHFAYDPLQREPKKAETES